MCMYIYIYIWSGGLFAKGLSIYNCKLCCSLLCRMENGHGGQAVAECTDSVRSLGSVAACVFYEM